jgi:histidine decarboxylase
MKAAMNHLHLKVAKSKSLLEKGYSSTPLEVRKSVMNIAVKIDNSKPVPVTAGRMFEIERRMQKAHANHLGYPYNLALQNPVKNSLGKYLINNLGDPYAGSHFASEVCDLEREAIHWLMDLWQCGNHDDYWGSIGASGTEGNLWALYLAREACPGAKLFYSEEAHYSIPKAARILGIEAVSVAATFDSAIEIPALYDAIDRHASGSAILALTCGTTVKGAHDNVAAAMACLQVNSITDRYVHLDGALNAMVLPFIDVVPHGIQASFAFGIDSISTSGHKMIGTPMPCGALIARRHHVERIASAVAYLRSNDTTLMGSRNGHAVLAMWSRLLGHNIEGYRDDVVECLKRTNWLVNILQSAGVPVLCNPYSLTVLFPQPEEKIVKTYQLACNNGDAHAIVMPSVTEELLGRFAVEYLKWWKSGHPSGETPSTAQCV